VRVEAIARVVHEANRAIQIETDDPTISPHWDLAPRWQQESAIEGVQHAVNGASAEELHEKWCESKRAKGWVWGPLKDADAKTHPCLVAYADLPAVQIVKDVLFAAIVGTLTETVKAAGAGDGDSFHTLQELYTARMQYNALLFNEWALFKRFPVFKSKRHDTGELCFDGEYFVVGTQVDEGQVTQHYPIADWAKFRVPELEVAPVWDGHDAKEGARRLNAAIEMYPPYSPLSRVLEGP